MILDRLENADRYAGLHAGFAAGLAFLRRTDLGSLAAGKYEIDGRRVYAIVDPQPGRGRAAARVEAHRAYIDMQYVARGTDVIGWRPLSLCRQVTQAYNSEKDIEFFGDAAEVWTALPAGTVAFYWPEDGHAPLASDGELLKVIIKVAVA